MACQVHPDDVVADEHQEFDSEKFSITFQCSFDSGYLHLVAVTALPCPRFSIVHWIASV